MPQRRDPRKEPIPKKYQDLYDLFTDPEWVLAASLGDIEFEQDMYDDIVYGDSYLDNPPTGYGIEVPEDVPDVRDIFPDYGYDKLALRGLRKHATKKDPVERLMRYLSPWVYDRQAQEGQDLLGSWSPPGIDFNIPRIAGARDYMNKHALDLMTRHHPPLEEFPGGIGTLQNYISDVARHEYKHGVVDNQHPYAHPAIYGSGAQYGISPYEMSSAYGSFINPTVYDSAWSKDINPHVSTSHVSGYNPDIAGDVVRDVVGPDRDDFRGL